MREDRWRYFVALGVGNGLTTGFALAAALAGHWIAAIGLLAGSMVCAGGMITTLGALRCVR